jgi:hypothetical protein
MSSVVLVLVVLSSRAEIKLFNQILFNVMSMRGNVVDTRNFTMIVRSGPQVRRSRSSRSNDNPLQGLYILKYVLSILVYINRVVTKFEDF